MKMLRKVKFSPGGNTAIRYWQDGGFRSDDEISIGSLSAPQQAVVAAALDWALARLPVGFTGLESVELSRVPDVETEWSTPNGPDEVPQVLATSPAFTAAIVGVGEKGQQPVEIVSAPGPETTALAGLWDYFEANENA